MFIMNDMNNLATAADLAQFYSLFLLLKDASNNEIMRALQDQNTLYFEDIIQRLDRIEKQLEVLNGNQAR